jgi:hypothetical protein
MHCLSFAAAAAALLQLPAVFAAAAGSKINTLCDGVTVSWVDCRAALIQKIFNRTSLPDQAEPNSIEVLSGYNMSGWPSPGQGVVPAPPPTPNGTSVDGTISTAGASAPAYAWANGLQRLTWNISSPFISLNSTVHYSFNTSGNAPANYPPPPSQPGHPTELDPDFNSFARPGKTLVLYHNGHETADCTPNYDGVVDDLNQLGYDVMEFMMPLLGCNQACVRARVQEPSSLPIARVFWGLPPQHNSLPLPVLYTNILLYFSDIFSTTTLPAPTVRGRMRFCCCSQASVRQPHLARMVPAMGGPGRLHDPVLPRARDPSSQLRRGRARLRPHRDAGPVGRRLDHHPRGGRRRSHRPQHARRRQRPQVRHHAVFASAAAPALGTGPP